MRVAGFAEAMRLRPDAWTATVELGDPDVEHAAPQMLTLHAIRVGESDMPKDSIDELAKQATDLIPTIVLTLNRRVKAQRGATGAFAGPAGFARRLAAAACDDASKGQTCHRIWSTGGRAHKRSWPGTGLLARPRSSRR